MPERIRTPEKERCGSVSQGRDDDLSVLLFSVRSYGPISRSVGAVETHEGESGEEYPLKKKSRHRGFTGLLDGFLTRGMTSNRSVVHFLIDTII